MYPPITYELLKSKGACRHQLNLVKEHFGLEPIPLTDEVIERFSSTFQMEWAALHLLTQVDLIEYRRVGDPRKYDFEETKQTTYDRCCSSWVTLHVDYKEIVQRAWDNYNKVIAKEFVRIYKRNAVILCQK